MLQQSLDFAFLRTKAYVVTELPGLTLNYSLRSEPSCAQGCPISAQQADKAGVFGSKVAKDAINQIFYLDLELKSSQPVVFPETVIEFKFQLDGVQSLWLPGMMQPAKNIRPKGILEYSQVVDLQTHICNFSPIGAFYSAEGLNKLSFALSDCKNLVKMEPGAYEEEESVKVCLRLFSVPCPAMTEYKTTLRLDTSLIPVFKALEQITAWQERTLNLNIMPVPESAYGPVYSTWYAFLQNLTAQEIEEQCAMAAKLGCKTVIVDDGWQTDDNNRGYAFCGDWKISKKRFPDMKAHVAKIHALGMKYMMWLSVPFMGKQAQNYPKYQEYTLNFNPRWGACTLDPRYPQVREFLVKTYVDLVTTYDLDGLKLDFIDEFDMRNADEKALAFDARRDTQSMAEAVDLLMSAVRQALQAINPEILIEFRQNYVGPMIRQYGNLFRAHDCPDDTLMNRMTTLDLRAISGNTAVHSDMYTWSPNESVETASLNFIHTLFAVPQISPNLKHLNEQHLAMIKHWLGFWNEHRELLMHGKLHAEKPEFCYSLAKACLGTEELILECIHSTVKLFEDPKTTHSIVVNGAMDESFLLKSARCGNALVKVYDCLGREVNSQQIELNQKIFELDVPKSGYATFDML